MSARIVIISAVESMNSAQKIDDEPIVLSIIKQILRNIDKNLELIEQQILTR